LLPLRKIFSRKHCALYDSGKAIIFPKQNLSSLSLDEANEINSDLLSSICGRELCVWFRSTKKLISEIKKRDKSRIKHYESIKKSGEQLILKGENDDGDLFKTVSPDSLSLMKKDGSVLASSQLVSKYQLQEYDESVLRDMLNDYASKCEKRTHVDDIFTSTDLTEIRNVSCGASIFVPIIGLFGKEVWCPPPSLTLPPAQDPHLESTPLSTHNLLEDFKAIISKEL
ncbi:hypothetical protein ADUPG1_009635, partial [Aduncisulcus paluster]